MSLTAEVGGFSELGPPVRAALKAGLFEVPCARLVWDLDAPELVPAPEDLFGARVVVGLERGAENTPEPQLLGRVHAVRVRRLGSRRHELELKVSTLPAEVFVGLSSRACWRTFPPDTALSDVFSELVEDLGLARPRFEPALDGRCPGQIVGGGRSALDLLRGLAAVHGRCLAFDPRKEPEAEDKVVLVATAEELGSRGRGVQASFEEGPGLNTLSSLELSVRVPESVGDVPWMEVDEERTWSAPSGSALVGALAPSEEIAQLRSAAAEGRAEGGRRILEAHLLEPFLGWGDRLELEGSVELEPSLEGALAEGSVVWEVSWEDAEGSGSAGFRGAVRMSPAGAELPRSSADLHAPILLSGTVEALTSDPVRVRARLDVPGALSGPRAPEVSAELTAPWFSGSKGGLHCPPLPGDRVLLHFDGRIYGRVVFVGAHPSKARLDAVRRVVSDGMQARFPKDGDAPLEEPLELGGGHLSRALVVGSEVASVWASAEVGFSQGDPVEAAAWTQVAGATGSGAWALAPGRCALSADGGDAIVGAWSEGRLGLEAESTLSSSAGEGSHHTAEDLKLYARGSSSWTSDEAFTLEAKSIEQAAAEATELSASELKVSVSGAVELSAGELTSSTDAATSIQGATVEIGATGGCALSGATMDVSSQGPSTITGTPLSLN